jgi:Dual specificity phosphatase, catalytic domain
MQETTDFRSHHIEGFARAAIENGTDGYFSVPLITELEPRLWMGGCRAGVRLPDDFHFVLSLYPWERYRLGPETERLEVKLYDAAEVPDEAQLYELADLVRAKRRDGKVLVHCQAGLNRSGLVTALALILGDMHPADAIAMLRRKRCDVVLCNSTFERWLLARPPRGGGVPLGGPGPGTAGGGVSSSVRIPDPGGLGAGRP